VDAFTEALWKETDKDSDGQITFSEFLAWFEKRLHNKEKHRHASSSSSAAPKKQ